MVDVCLLSNLSIVRKIRYFKDQQTEVVLGMAKHKSFAQHGLTVNINLIREGS
jgi:hypothetical protein